MAPKRRERGSLIEPKQFKHVIEGHYKDRFEQLALTAGVSGAVFLEAVIDHLETELTDRGVPSWWPAPEPKDGELDMPSP